MFYVEIILMHHKMQSSGEDGSLVVDYFTFSSSIADYLTSASLVISHAGIIIFLYNFHASNYPI